MHHRTTAPVRCGRLLIELIVFPHICISGWNSQTLLPSLRFRRGVVKIAELNRATSSLATSATVCQSAALELAR